jgi:DNA-damage-inducible protein J
VTTQDRRWRVNQANALDTKSADVRLRLEPELKAIANQVLKDAGLSLSDAIRIFLRQVVAHRGLPFEVKQPNETTLRAMEEARAMAKLRFSSATELFDELEKKPQRKSRKASAKK